MKNPRPRSNFDDGRGLIYFFEKVLCTADKRMVFRSSFCFCFCFSFCSLAWRALVLPIALIFSKEISSSGSLGFSAKKAGTGIFSSRDRPEMMVFYNRIAKWKSEITHFLHKGTSC